MGDKKHHWVAENGCQVPVDAALPENLERYCVVVDAIAEPACVLTSPT